MYNQSVPNQFVQRAGRGASSGQGNGVNAVLRSGLSYDPYAQNAGGQQLSPRRQNAANNRNVGGQRRNALAPQ